jgi:D-serine deaminase-like pyridoxal phosphate-dependent protein
LDIDSKLTLDSLPTPAVVIDRARAIRNLERMQAAATSGGIRLRPHAKTHKSPLIARWQIERGAAGICCAKVGEAEVFAAAGIPDIRLPYPINPANADRVIALLDRTRLSFIVDHPVVAKQWSDAMMRAGRQVDVLVKVDVGFHRCGIDPATDDAVAMIRGVAGLPGLRFKGLLSHAGHAYHAHSEDELCRMATDEPGNYMYFDRTQVALGAATLDDCALTVMARVVSKPAADRIIFDSGSKTLTNDGARGFTPAPGFGVVLQEDGTADTNLLIERLSEEHATVKVVGGSTSLEPGDVVRIVPNHSCVVSNLVDQVWLLDGKTVEPMPIAARGKNT